jgi:hypothetical protein
MNKELIVQQPQCVVDPLIVERVDEFPDERPGILGLSRHRSSHLGGYSRAEGYAPPMGNPACSLED